MRVVLLLLCYVPSLLFADNPKWSGCFAAGLTSDWGNTRNTDVSLNGTVSRDVLRCEDEILYQHVVYGKYKYKKKNGKISDDKGEVKAVYRHYVNERISWQVWQKVEQDQVKDLNLYSLSVLGLGYWVIVGDKVSVFLESGLGYGIKRYSGGRNSEDDITWASSVTYSQSITEWWDFHNKFEYVLPLGHTEQYSWEEVATFYFKLKGCWGLDVSYELDYDNNPPPNKKSLDRTLEMKLKYTF